MCCTRLRHQQSASPAAVYLWTVPAHREVWKALAAEEGGRGLYLAFADVICNDSQYLLDDVIRSLPEVCALAGEFCHALPIFDH